MPEHINISEPLRRFRETITSLDQQFARLVCRLAGERSSEELYLAAALASHLTLEGKQVCFDLTRAQARQSLTEFFPNLFQGHRQTDQEWMDILDTIPIPDNWQEKLIDSKMVAEASTDKNMYKPLVLDKGKLYLHRYWQYEQDLTSSLLDRLKQNHLGNHGPYQLKIKDLKQEILSVSSLFKGQDPDKISLNQQFLAVQTALNSYLTVITGGPGTGKTTIVSVILAILLWHRPELRIALCAPTGKAQARIKESLIEEQSHLLCPDEVKNRLLNLNPSTIHRLLGSKPNSVFFRHNLNHPLNIDLLIVDEVSMVSLPLMAKLMEAVPAPAGVILLGDKDQLASIESGAVLADICDSLPLVGGYESDHKQHQGAGVVELRTSYRFREQGGIGKLKKLIEQGLGKEALDLLDSDQSGELEYRPLPDPKDLPFVLNDFVSNWAIETEDESICFKDCLKYSPRACSKSLERTVSQAYAHFSRFRILCAFRRGPFGIEYVNQVLRKVMGKTAAYCHGLPIMVTSNDHVLNLYNGDIGLCWQVYDQALKVFFPSPDQHRKGDAPQFRTFLPSQLPEHEPVFSMTVHKAQGSGFDNLLFILPDYDSPILTRELVYTALTRARKKISIWASREIFSSAISRVTLRPSGLRENLIRSAPNISRSAGQSDD